MITFDPITEIIVNTPTRTGSTFLCNEMKNYLKIVDADIIKTHDPEMLLNGKDLQIVLLRNPYDSILSMITMDKRNGSIDVGTDIVDRISHFSQMLDSFMISYIRCIPFTFDQVIEDTDSVIMEISKIFNIEYRAIPLNKRVIDRHNFVETSKSLSYYEDLKNSLSSYKKELEELQKKYKKALQFLEFRQAQLKFII
jgi:hypothetical protein